jgi:hypothetical protein
MVKISPMKDSNEELVALLAQFNPWWRGEAIADLPKWRRAAFRDLNAWMTAPPAPRSVLLSGARQTGKTTLMQQSMDALLCAGIPAANILYATFDHPMLKLAGIDAVLDAWREREPKSLDDFGVMTGLPRTAPQGDQPPTQIMRIPAPLFCYRMGVSERNQPEPQD